MSLENPTESVEDSVRSVLEQSPDVYTTLETPEDVMSAALLVVDNMPEGHDLLAKIESARRNDDRLLETATVNKRRRLWQTVAVEISLITGIEIDEAEHDAQRQIYKGQIQNILGSVDPNASDEAIMLKLDIIKPTENKTGYTFHFPRKILPPYIKERWDAYTGMVDQFDDAANKLKNGLMTQTEFNAIDLLRTKAHNTVSSSVAEMLEFPEWELDDYRRLVGKMRDQKYAEPKGELARYAKEFRDLAPREHLTTIQKHIGEKITSKTIEG